MPPPKPQTLLLTALALLIAAATLMLACGPAAQPAPDGGMATLPAATVDAPNTLPPAPQEGGDSAGESGDETPTEIPPPPPKPTFTYPNIGDSGLHFDVVEFEEAQKSANGPSGQSDATVEDSVVYIEISLSANTAEVADWLRSKGVSPLYAADGYIDAEVPLSLMGELSRQEGVIRISRPAPSAPSS